MLKVDYRLEILKSISVVVFFKELVLTKYLFIYLLQQAKSFNSGRNAS